MFMFSTYMPLEKIGNVQKARLGFLELWGMTLSYICEHLLQKIHHPIKKKKLKSRLNSECVTMLVLD